MNRSNLILVVGLVHLYLSIVNFDNTLRLEAKVRSLLQEDAGSFLNFNYPGIVFLVFSVLSFLYWFYIRKWRRQGMKVSHTLAIGLLLFITPFIVNQVIGTRSTAGAYRFLLEEADR